MRALLFSSTAVLLLACPAQAVAQQKKPATTAPAPAAVAANPVVSPEIRAELGKMADALKAMTSFVLRADVTNEEVLDTGQKLQNSGVLTFTARRPDRLLIDIDSEQRKRRIYYDGKMLTVFSPTTGYYASVDAPPTTRQMLDTVAAKYGLETPLADLMEWGSAGVSTDKLTSAIYAGRDRISGAVCEHYAFRQPGVDWQLWIRAEGQPLPCKLAITNTDDDAQPQSTMTFNWSTSEPITESQFVFAPPANGRKIILGEVAQNAAQARPK